MLYEVPTYLALNLNRSDKQKNKKKKAMGKIKRIIFWYCLVAILLLTPLPKYFGIWLFYVQIVHLLILILIGFSKNFTLWKIEK